MAKRRLPDPTTVLRAITEAGDELDMSRLASELLRAFGGNRGLADKCAEHFDTTTSTMARGKMLEAVMRVLAAATPKFDPFADLTALKTEELQRLVGKLLPKAADSAAELGAERP